MNIRTCITDSGSGTNYGRPVKMKGSERWRRRSEDDDGQFAVMRKSCVEAATRVQCAGLTGLAGQRTAGGGPIAMVISVLRRNLAQGQLLETRESFQVVAVPFRCSQREKIKRPAASRSDEKRCRRECGSWIGRWVGRSSSLLRRACLQVSSGSHWRWIGWRLWDRGLGLMEQQGS